MVSLKEKLLFLKEIGEEFIIKEALYKKNRSNKSKVLIESSSTNIKKNFSYKKEKSLENIDLKQRLLQKVKEEVFSCKRCPLFSTKTNYVFGEGNINAKIMFVGEAPGEDEDKQGKPFVGKAGQLLTKMIKAMGYKREEVYIANILKCRPPGNKTPDKNLRRTCFPYLQKQIAIIKPEVIVALGKVAAQTLLDTEVKISKLRGVWGEYQGIPVMSTYHPAYILRNYTQKVRREAWEDLKKVMEHIGKNR